MKKARILFALIIVSCQIAWGLTIPELNRKRIHDEAGILSTEEVSKLEAKLAEHEKSSSNQVAVLIMKSLEDENLEDFSIKVAEKWKIGQKGKDNGVLLLFFMDEKKDRIEVGYGLESVLTDAICERILTKEIQPKFKEEEYYKGIDVAVDKIFASISGEYQKEITAEGKTNTFLILLAILAIVAGILGYTHWSVSGIAGGIGSPIIWSWIFGAVSTSSMALLIILGIVGGLIAHFIMSVALGGGTSGNDFGSGILFSGDSSGSSGDSFFGGGGDFGGGGASGDW